MKRKEKPTGRWQARNTHLRKHVVFSRIFKRMVPVDYYQSKKKYRNLFFYLSSNSFASFLLQTFNFVHRSLHLSTWSPRFISHDLYVRCRSLASRAKLSSSSSSSSSSFFFFFFGGGGGGGSPKINSSNSKLSMF